MHFLAMTLRGGTATCRDGGHPRICMMACGHLPRFPVLHGPPSCRAGHMQAEEGASQRRLGETEVSDSNPDLGLMP